MADCDLLVIGAGAAGLAAGITAARAGKRVLLLESAPEPGRKILLTGGGRCNLSNAALGARAPRLADYYGAAGAFVRPALGACPLAAVLGFFQSLGLETTAPDDIHYYPRSEKAADVRDALALALAAAGGETVTGFTVKKLAPDGNGWLAADADGRTFSGEKCLLATGGVSPRALAADAWTPALDTGHALTPARPALAPLTVDDFPCAALSGISVPAELRLGGGKKAPRAAGDLLFTHTGISGPAVLDISADAADAVRTDARAEISVDFVPAVPDWAGEFSAWRREDGKKTVLSLLKTRLPEALGRTLLELSGTAPDRRTAELTAKESAALAQNLAARKMSVTRLDGFHKAMVTRGGVALKEVNPHTLESRKAPGLYFAGEILDVDGRCGGFNLHWAWASGILAARSAARAD